MHSCLELDSRARSHGVEEFTPCCLITKSQSTHAVSLVECHTSIAQNIAVNRGRPFAEMAVHAALERTCPFSLRLCAREAVSPCRRELTGRAVETCIKLLPPRRLPIDVFSSTCSKASDCAQERQESDNCRRQSQPIRTTLGGERRTVPYLNVAIAVAYQGLVIWVSYLTTVGKLDGVQRPLISADAQFVD